MRVAIIGTYPPTRCGIATFTADVEQALQEVGVEVQVVVIDRDPSLPPNGVPAVDSDSRASYAEAAAWLNSSGVDLVLIEHEFGIHGGEDGSHLLDLTLRLRVPYVVTLHTVLSQFTSSQSATLEALCTNAAAVTVFTPSARRMMVEQELAPSQSIVVVPHGAPVELYQPTGRTLRRELGVPAGARVASTFGLLSPGKGLEVAILAMRRVVDRMPDARYVIAGRTHPGVQRHEGEQYRARLLALVDSLELDEHVVFVDRFLTVDEIAELLSFTDVFLTPYRNADQIVSGALTFAIAAGCPVVSTPYRYGCEMVGDGAGLLVPFDDPDAFADATLALLADGPARTRALDAAAEMSATLSWPAVGRTLQRVLVAALDRVEQQRIDGRPSGQRLLPPPHHLFVLLDDTTVMQHAAHHVPRLEEGYCVDDTARLLPVAARAAHEADADPRWTSVVPHLLAYLRAAARGGEGLMRNFMSWDRHWLDAPHDGDHIGRAIWGLGELVELDEMVDEATELLRTLVDRPLDQPWPRLVAYRALGLLAAGDRLPADAALADLHQRVRAWRPPAGQVDWDWPEPRVVYDAGRVPEVMMRLGARMGDREMVERGIEHLVWLERRCRVDDHYRFPGHLGLSPGDELPQSGDEQPLEAAAMIDAAVACFRLTGDQWAEAVAERAWSWFLGNNRLGIRVGSFADGACRDALTADGVNLNCGAESTISFHRSALAIERLRRRRSDWSRACSNATPTTR